MIDFKKMTDVDLAAHTRKFIESSYQETEQYRLVVDEDLLTTGLFRFGVKVTQAWGWGHRVMAMLGEGRRLVTSLTSTLRGKERLLAEVMHSYKMANRNGLLKGLDATERQQAAFQTHRTYVNDVETWVVLEDEMRALLKYLDMRLGDLNVARHDIRSLLGNVRTQGSLGEVPYGGDPVGQSESSGYFKRKIPPPSPTGLQGNVQEGGGSDVDIDNLLGDKEP